MLTIRLNRVGVRRKPVYRIVLVDSKKKKGGKAHEVLGFWQPGKDLKSVNTEKIKAWTTKGARLSKSVASLIERLK